MTRPENAAAWRPQAKAPRSRSIFKAVVIGAVGLIIAQYFAGFLFLWWFRLDPRTATPMTITRYAYYYGERSDVHRRVVLSSAAGIAVLLVPALALLVPKKPALHGEARFATTQEIAQAGLFAEEGIVMGVPLGFWEFLGRRFIIQGGQLGATLSAQPRSGKGVSVVIPTLLSYSQSVVVTDIKKENWLITSGYRRSMGQEVHLFDPLSRSGRTSRWNPLDYVAEDYGQRISDLQLIANMFIPDPLGADPFWSSGGRTLFLGISLYLFYTPTHPCTIGEVLRQGMANDEEGFSHHWKRIIEGRQHGRNPLPDVCVRALSDIIDLAPQTMSSIRRTFTGKLELWLNPVLDAATSASDFDLRDLRKRPISIFLGIMPKDLERLTPLVSLFFQQAIALQTDELPEHNSALKYQVTMVLDEIPSLGKLPILAKSSGYLPGFNVVTLMIMQSPSQLYDIYGENGAKTLLKTIGARIYFAPKDMEDAEEISKELGNTTVKVRSVSRPAFSLSGKGRGSSISTSLQRRPLMLPQEVKEMGAQRQIIFAENVRPILAKKIRYYLMPVFLKRLRLPPTVPKVKAIALKRAVATVDPDVTPQVEVGAVGTRDATVEDIEHIESLTLDDFATDFSTVEIPQKAEGERLTERELQVAVDSFLASLQER